MSMSFWEADIRSQSEAKGEDKLSKLIALLLEKNNIEAIQKVTKDASFRKQLYKEYGIN